jgi:TATA-box binding protein (TBP) (component of TFIID and TFIIIB)
MDNLKINISNLLKSNHLDSTIGISNISFSCKLNNTILNCENIAKYIELSNHDIFYIIYKTQNDTIIKRTLNNDKNNNYKNIYYNQILIHAKIPNNNIIHIKLFSNGTIHITGCKSETDIYNAIILITNKLKNNINFDKFTSDQQDISIENITNLNISMITAHFNIKHDINLNIFYSFLLSQNIGSYYDGSIYSCAKIDYENNNKIMQIFQFEGGSIIITKATDFEQISNAQKYITNLINSCFNYDITNDNIHMDNIRFDNIIIDPNTIIDI